MYKPNSNMRKMKLQWEKRIRLEYKKSYAIAYGKISNQNYLGNSHFKYNYFDIRDALNEHISNINLKDIEYLLTK